MRPDESENRSQYVRNKKGDVCPTEYLVMSSNVSVIQICDYLKHYS